MTKPIKTKDSTFANILTLLRTNPPFKSAEHMVPVYERQFGRKIDRSTISRHLKENGIQKVNGYYSKASNAALEKKEALIKDLCKQSSLKLVPDYEVVFVSVDSMYADFIAHQLQSHEIFQEHTLGIVPYQNAIMIFCKLGSKEIIERVINSYVE